MGFSSLIACHLICQLRWAVFGRCRNRPVLDKDGSDSVAYAYGHSTKKLQENQKTKRVTKQQSDLILMNVEYWSFFHQHFGNSIHTKIIGYCVLCLAAQPEPSGLAKIVEPATFRSRVRRSTTAPPRVTSTNVAQCNHLAMHLAATASRLLNTPKLAPLDAPLEPNCQMRCTNYLPGFR